MKERKQLASNNNFKRVEEEEKNIILKQKKIKDLENTFGTKR